MYRAKNADFQQKTPIASSRGARKTNPDRDIADLTNPELPA